MTTDSIDTHQENADEGIRSSKDTQERVFVTGVPYFHPSFTFSVDEAANRLDSWDRIVLFGGGCVLGVACGAGTTLLVVSTHGDTLKVGLLICALMIVLNAVVCFGVCFRTERMIGRFSRLLDDIPEAMPPEVTVQS